MDQSKMPITKEKQLNFGGPHNKFKISQIEFSVKLGKHSTRTQGSVPNRVRLKENLQKSTLAINAPFLVVN